MGTLQVGQDVAIVSGRHRGLTGSISYSYAHEIMVTLTASGEEVTVAYVGGAEAGIRAARQTILLDKYQFACSCDACSLHGGALEASEARQSRLQAIHRSLPSSPETLVELSDLIAHESE